MPFRSTRNVRSSLQDLLAETSTLTVKSANDEDLERHLPTPLRLGVFADSRVGWVVASLSV
jgi:hypothetical protein